MFADEDGRRAVRWARRSVERALAAPPLAADGADDAAALSPVFAERRGTFVTWKRHPSGELRGCIGFPRPVLPLGRAIAEAAVAAATEDPRFRPIRAADLGSLTVDVSVLTPPEPIARPGPTEVVVGRDGLIVEGRGTSGLLLPQVAVEERWDSLTFLAATCEKAGLPSGAWRDPTIRVLRFGADVFRERTPGGDVERESLAVSPSAGRRPPRS